MELKGKPLSLGSKLFAGTFVLVTYVLGLVFRWNIDVTDLVYVGGFIAVLFTPIDASMIAEKFSRSSYQPSRHVQVSNISREPSDPEIAGG